jgi:hypothetical protein
MAGCLRPEPANGCLRPEPANGCLRPEPANGCLRPEPAPLVSPRFPAAINRYTYANIETAIQEFRRCEQRQPDGQVWITSELHLSQRNRY